MIYWKLIWQILFIFGFISFIVMFFIFSVKGFIELKFLLKDNNNEK